MLQLTLSLILLIIIALLVFSPIKVRFTTVGLGVKFPSKRKEDAGYDIYPYFSQQYIKIDPHQTVMIPTGLKSSLPKSYYIQLAERGSIGSKGAALRCGVIDSGYRGEWFVPITNTTNRLMFIAKDPEYIKFHFGDDCIVFPYAKAICQAIIMPSYNTKWRRVSSVAFEKYESERGVGKLGSSGK